MTCVKTQVFRSILIFQYKFLKPRLLCKVIFVIVHQHTSRFFGPDTLGQSRSFVILIFVTIVILRRRHSELIENVLKFKLIFEQVKRSKCEGQNIYFEPISFNRLS